MNPVIKIRIGDLLHFQYLESNAILRITGLSRIGMRGYLSHVLVSGHLYHALSPIEVPLATISHVQTWSDDVGEFARVARGESNLPRRGCRCTTCDDARRIRKAAKRAVRRAMRQKSSLVQSPE